jgi:homoserine kinase
VALIRVPASSANLGPGFDAVGMALTLHMTVATGDDGHDLPVVDDRHPAAVAYRHFGGTGALRVRSPIPAGRGLGFSGAARVGGAVAALVTRGADVDLAAVVEATAAMEGHADNVAASAYGGVAVSAAGRTVRVPLAIDPAVIAWVPSATTTSTDESRARLGRQVPFDDAVFSVGRAALLVAALAAGDVAALRAGTEDRLHQPVRIPPGSVGAGVIETALAAGAWAAWLSGSGPTVAAACPLDRCDDVVAAMPADDGAGPVSVKVLRIDHQGVAVERG